jgi:Cysteine-rich secretory protein family
VNEYRAMVKLAPVADDPALSEGERNHTRYLVGNYASFIHRGINIGAEMHSEDPAKPGYTPVGFHAAQSSDIDEWPGPRPPLSPNWAVDDWMTGAFHRLNVLNPSLRDVAYGESCNGGTCAAALDVLSGAQRPSLYPKLLPAPIQFPPPGATVALGPLFGEWPDPLTACPGYRSPAGLPVTLALGSMVNTRLTAYRLVRDGDPPTAIDACGFDASSYVNPDAAAQQRARRVLLDFGAVVLVPRAPLRKGASYTVSMTVNGREYEWSFSTAS